VTATVSSAHPIQALPSVGEAAICMGVFDGVHLGHRALVATTVSAARQRGIQAIALVFDPHPDEVVRPGTRVPRLGTLAENLRRLQEAGIDAPIPVQFDADLRALTPEEFLAAMRPAVTARVLAMTPDAAFGRNRSGTPDAMRLHGRDAGFDLVLAGLVADADGPISSERVRSAIAEGDIGDAARMLGHPAFLEATPVRRGDQGWLLAYEYAPAQPGPGSYEARIRAADADGDRPARLVIDEEAVAWLEAPLDPGNGPFGIDLRENG
jgi:riboflavin kinase / FMN adenylyltransferase